jgi:dTDP-L-rhamnose 4-epimerase
MMGRVLITGGCGFIGKNLSLAMTRRNLKITIIDSLSEQIHGMSPDLSWIDEAGIEFIKGSVMDRGAMELALKDVSTVVHLAAETGTGQSMYDIADYMDTNVVGTAIVLEECNKAGVRHFVLSSSRAIFGEGTWLCSSCGRAHARARGIDFDSSASWNPICSRCGLHTESMIAVKENDEKDPVSVYGISKLAQEQLVALVAGNSNMCCSSLRFFNVFGPGQSLKNPYTGVLAVFATRARQNKHLDIFEDGKIQRDFVYIDDVVEALQKAIDMKFNGACNIGSGSAVTIEYTAKKIVEYVRSGSKLCHTGKTRVGDVRGLVADIGNASRELGWIPRISFEKGLGNFVDWAMRSESVDLYEESMTELSKKGLYH